MASDFKSTRYLTITSVELAQGDLGKGPCQVLVTILISSKTLVLCLTYFGM